MSTRAPDAGTAAARTAGVGVQRASRWLAAAAAALALLAALLGLLVDDVYTGDPATAAMLRGYDLVTAVLAVPAAAWALRRSVEGSVRARLAVASLCAYFAYTYALYVFGTGFNDLFLLHAALLAVAVAALVTSLVAVDTGAVAATLGHNPLRPVAAVLATLAVALGGMWVWVSLDNAVTGEVPAGSSLVETDAMVHLGIALDLVLLVPLYGVAAVLLWRLRPWGIVLAAVALLSGVLHQVGYLVAMPFQVWGDVPGAVAYDPVEPVIVLLYVVASGLLLGPPRRSTEVRSHR